MLDRQVKIGNNFLIRQLMRLKKLVGHPLRMEVQETQINMTPSSFRKPPQKAGKCP